MTSREVHSNFHRLAILLAACKRRVGDFASHRFVHSAQAQAIYSGSGAALRARRSPPVAAAAARNAVRRAPDLPQHRCSVTVSAHAQPLSAHKSGCTVTHVRHVSHTYRSSGLVRSSTFTTTLVKVPCVLDTNYILWNG